MCAIAGIFDTRGPGAIDRSTLKAMCDSMSHRGPDGEGFHLAPGVGLGHRRLAIIDLSTGDQPVYNEDRSIAIVFNGEIYNYRELTADLVKRGHVFRTRSDTEAIVHAWEEWGEGCLDRLTGMFAFALHDSRAHSLVLARDRLGEKPLYYAMLADGKLAFASELQALTALAGFDRRLDPLAIEDYFAFGYVPDPRTIHRGAMKLEPGHVLVARQGEGLAAPRSYWDVRFRDDGPRSEGEAAEALRAILGRSVAARLVADVPLGAFLSGGVDSSAVVALMANNAAGPVKTFAIGFDDAAHDETPYARRIARRYGTDHHERVVDSSAVGAMARLARIYAEPFADPSALATLKVAQVARERVTVALSGDGGDEVFAGYRRYPWHVRVDRVRAHLPRALRHGVFGALALAYPKLDEWPRPLRFKTTFEELAADSAEGYANSVAAVPTRLREGLYSPTLRGELAGYRAHEVIARHLARAGGDDPLSQAQYADLKTWLPGRMLVKVDRASMAASLEVRVPLLDHHLVEWAASLPPRLRLNGGEGKHILKHAMEPLVDHDILYRPKQGFAPPVAKWLRGPLREELRSALTDPRLADCGHLDMRAIGDLVDDHLAGRRDHSQPLWAIWMFAAFLRQTDRAA